MIKRSNFYPNGEIIDFRLPQDLDNHKEVKVVVARVDNTATKEHFVIFIRVLV